jgi:hypothetical protein
MRFNSGNVLMDNGGYLQNNQSIRSPIFYDSDNTAYYVDPATFTELQGGIRNNGSHANSQIINRLPAANNANGTGVVQLQMWCSEPSVGWEGAGFGYNVTNDGGSPNGFGRLNTSFGQGYMRFASSGDIYFYNTNTSGTRVTNMELYPNNTVLFNNYATGGNSLRAPIFYDSNDTSYFVNPRSNSRMSGLRLDGIDNQASGDDAILWIPKPNNNDWAMLVSGDLDYGIDLRMASGNSFAFRVLGGGAEHARLNSDYFFHYSDIRTPIFYDSNNTNYYIDPTSISRLGILRIVDATSGYSLMLGPEQTSINGVTHVYNDNQRYSLQVNAPYYPHIGIGSTLNGGNTTHGGVLSFQGFRTAGGFRRFVMGIANTNPDELSFGWYDNDANPHYGVGINWSYPASIWYNTNHDFYVRNNVYSYGWYDRNDTAYRIEGSATNRLWYLGVGYRDPSTRLHVIGDHGSSNLRVTLRSESNGQGLGDVSLQMWASEPGVTWSDAGFGYNVTNDGGSPNGFGRLNGGLGQGYMRFSTGGNIYFYNTNTSGTRFTTMEWYSGNYVYANNYLQAGNSLRAPIYYDSNDTAKYLQRNTSSYTSWYMGGSNNGYSGWNVDGSMHLMLHTGGTGAPCGFYHPSQGWSVLAYTNGQCRFHWAANIRIETTDWGTYFTGDVRASGDVIAYYSDARLKENVEVIPNAIDKIKKLRGVTYDWNNEKVNVVKNRAGKRDIGLIAQEVEAIEPLLTKEYQIQLNETPKKAEDAINFVPELSEMYKTIKYDKLVALLVEGMKEQQQQIEELKNEIQKLKEK